MTKYAMGLDVTRCVGCQTCVVACQMEHNTRPGIAWATVDAAETGVWPETDRTYVPRGCQHCADAPCVAACPTGASIQREDGIVVVDYEKCIGCGLCLPACPYGARQLSDQDVWHFGAAEPAPYEAYGVQRVNVAEKCVFCAERLDAGKNPRCVDACFFGVRVFGDLDDPESAISAFVANNEVESVPGSAVYYVKGKYGFDLAETLTATQKDGE